MGIYVYHDVFFHYFQRAPRLTDIKNYPALFEVSLPLALLTGVYVLCITVPTLFCGIQNLLTGSKGKQLVTMLQLTGLILLSLFLFSPKAYEYQKKNLHFTDWSTAKNIRENGRFSSLIYTYNKRLETISVINQSPALAISDFLYTKRTYRKPDIHIIILESFINPENIRDLFFKSSPIHPGLSPFLLEDGNFSIVQSPVYGGGTAQSEFELLTGIPALGLVESIEFNLFDGKRTHSFVEQLNQLGYYTLASIGTKAKFYNSGAAYKGIGFQEISYLNNGYFQKSKGDEYIFDGDLFEANLQHLDSNTSHAGPVLNYVVGMYGHMPYSRNLTLRPDVIPTNNKREPIHNIANQFYYRTQALAQYLNALHKRKRETIILVVSDHLPPIFNSHIRYQYDKLKNIAILLHNFQPVNITGKNYYEIPHILWNIMSDTPSPTDVRSHAINTHKNALYYSFIREAMALTPQ